MRHVLKGMIPSAIWITLSEFLRNEVLLKASWTAHYSALGLEFQTLWVNGVLWTLWSVGLSYTIFRIMGKFSKIETLVITWIPSFLMMWIVAYNLQVLPLGVLVYAIPLSVVEIYVAMLLMNRFGSES